MTKMKVAPSASASECGEALVTGDTAIFENARPLEDERGFLLKLYVTGPTPASTRALANIKRICEKHLRGRYKLEVIDIYQNPELAREHQILAAPTLIKMLPLPIRRLIGDMSQEDRVLAGLDAVKKVFKRKTVKTATKKTTKKRRSKKPSSRSK
jgi:circadian clock protein KaiB